MPRTRPIELPVALLLATAAFAFSVAGACAVLLAGLVVLAGHAEVVLRAGWPTWCAGAALGCANVAGLLALTRGVGGLHPLALAAAWLLGCAVPLSGAPLPAAVVAAAGTGLAVRLGGGHGAAPGARPAAALLAGVALALLVVAFDGTDGAAGPVARVATPAAAIPARAELPRTAEAPAPRAGDAPPAPPAGDTPAVPPARPAAVVRRYYRALDARAFPRAWRLLTPSVRTAFGGFAHWRAGFAATLSSRPIALQTLRAGDERVVVHRLDARDRAACGVLARSFAVRWRLARTAAGWRATALTGTPATAPACGT